MKKSKPGKPAKESAAPKPEAFPRKNVICRSGPTDDEKGRAYARLLNSPELAAHRVISMMQPKSLADDLDWPTMLATLQDQATAVQGGDLAHAEAMLINQASALQALFVRLSERAMEQSHMPNLEGFMRLSLRAQSQCRGTLETLAAIKNPPIVYARQANVTTGPQQINNGTATLSQAREFGNQQTQLSESANELLPNPGASSLTSQADPTLEAVGEIDGAKVPRG